MKVSVLLPVYNPKIDFLKESIESILSQTYADFELIIINDCSTDTNVEKTIKTYHDKRIRYFLIKVYTVNNNLNSTLA